MAVHPSPPSGGRLAAYGLGPAAWNRIASRRQALEAALPVAVAAFYRCLDGQGAPAGPSAGHGTEASVVVSASPQHQARLQHWRRLLSGALDDAGLDQFHQKGSLQEPGEIDAPAYVAAYEAALRPLQAATARSCGLSRVFGRSPSSSAAGALSETAETREPADLVRSALLLDLELTLRHAHQHQENDVSHMREQLLSLGNSLDAELQTSIAKITKQASDLQSMAVAMSSAADQVSSRVQAVTKAADSATSQVESLAASADLLAQASQEIGARMTESTEVAQEAVNQARTANQIVDGLSDAATRINEIVALINGIAAQTNLLALNATIEAARAGDAGRGFAVVASEVKTLATQTQGATGDVGSQADSIQSATSQAVAAIRSIDGTVDQINDIAGTIAGSVQDQASATSEISVSAQGAAADTRQVTDNITQVSNVAKETNRLAKEVEVIAVQVSDDLEAMYGRMRAILSRAATGGDRRRYPKDSAGLGITLTLSGQQQAARLLDIAQGGARVTLTNPGSIGTSLSLSIPGLPVPLPSHVLALRPDCTILRFDLDGAQSRALQEWLQQTNLLEAI